MAYFGVAEAQIPTGRHRSSGFAIAIQGLTAAARLDEQRLPVLALAKTCKAVCRASSANTSEPGFPSTTARLSKSSFTGQRSGPMATLIGDELLRFLDVRAPSALTNIYATFQPSRGKLKNFLLCQRNYFRPEGSREAPPSRCPGP